MKLTWNKSTSAIAKTASPLCLAIALLTASFLSATNYYTLSDGDYNDLVSVWSNNGTDPCGCSPGFNIPGLRDTIVIQHKITMTNDIRMGGRSDFSIDQGASLEGPFDFLIANASLVNRGRIRVHNVTLNRAGHFLTTNESNLTGNLICNEARVELSGVLNIDGDVLNQNQGFIQIFTNSTMLVGGVYNNEGRTDIAAGACINLIADFTNPTRGQVTGQGYVQSFNDITNLGVWETTVSWCAQGVGTGLPTSPNCISCGILPVELSGFDGVYDPQTRRVRLQWQTASEINNDFFTVERSRDGQHYDPLGTVPAQASRTRGGSYQLEDAQPEPGQLYYRLRQTDIDGSTKVLGVIQVDASGSIRSRVSVYPNPCTETLRISLSAPTEAQLQLNLRDLQGRLLHHQKSSTRSHYHHETLSLTELPAGTYLLQLQIGDERHLQKFVKH